MLGSGFRFRQVIRLVWLPAVLKEKEEKEKRRKQIQQQTNRNGKREKNEASMLAHANPLWV